jgi:two-component system, sensor histidine kinase PdtaS
LRDVCTDAICANSHCQLEFAADPRIHVDADRAIPIALIVNELITNAAKHAFPGGPSRGGIAVRLTESTDASILLTVSDKGPGLPADFDIAKSKGLGMRVVIALTQQLGGTITYRSGVDGTEFILSIPIVGRIWFVRT